MMKQSKKVSIIGLGWIGLPLARFLKKKGISCIGSSTSLEKACNLQQEGINAIQFELIPYPTGNGFHALFQAEVLIINIPPRSKTQNGSFYHEQLKFLKNLIENSPIKKVLFISSTGIYPMMDCTDEYTEQYPIDISNTGSPDLLKAEQILSKKENYDITIIRFGGLMGEDRIPGKYFSGKDMIAGHTRVNFIHRQDAVRIMQWVIQHELWNETFNAVAPLHPLRRAIYEKNTMDMGIAPPNSYQQGKEGLNRLISSEKIIKTGFQFLYPDPLEFKYSPA